MLVGTITMPSLASELMTKKNMKVADKDNVEVGLAVDSDDPDEENAEANDDDADDFVEKPVSRWRGKSSQPAKSSTKAKRTKNNASPTKASSAKAVGNPSAVITVDSTASESFDVLVHPGPSTSTFGKKTSTFKVPAKPAPKKEGKIASVNYDPTTDQDFPTHVSFKILNFCNKCFIHINQLFNLIKPLQVRLEQH